MYFPDTPYSPCMSTPLLLFTFILKWFAVDLSLARIPVDASGHKQSVNKYFVLISCDICSTLIRVLECVYVRLTVNMPVIDISILFTGFCNKQRLWMTFFMDTVTFFKLTLIASFLNWYIPLFFFSYSHIGLNFCTCCRYLPGWHSEWQCNFCTGN